MKKFTLLIVPLFLSSCSFIKIYMPGELPIPSPGKGIIVTKDVMNICSVNDSILNSVEKKLELLPDDYEIGLAVQTQPQFVWEKKQYSKKYVKFKIIEGHQYSIEMKKTLISSTNMGSSVINQYSWDVSVYDVTGGERKYITQDYESLQKEQMRAMINSAQDYVNAKDKFGKMYPMIPDTDKTKLDGEWIGKIKVQNSLIKGEIVFSISEGGYILKYLKIILENEKKIWTTKYDDLSTTLDWNRYNPYMKNINLGEKFSLKNPDGSKTLIYLQFDSNLKEAHGFVEMENPATQNREKWDWSANILSSIK